MNFKDFEQENELLIKIFSLSEKCKSGAKESISIIDYEKTPIIEIISECFRICITPLVPPDRKLDYVYIRSIYVLPELRKHKIASNFVNGLISNCKRVGINRIEVEPFDESMFFWNKYGFIEIENKENPGVKRLALNF